MAKKQLTRSTQKRTSIFRVMLTPNERKLLEQAARIAGYNQLAVWARTILLEEAATRKRIPF